MSVLTTESVNSGQSATTQDAGSSQAAGGSNGTTNANAGNSNGNASSNWRDILPDDLKANASLLQMPDVVSLAKSYVHAQSMVGKKGVIPPTEKSADEEWSAFYKSIGQPELDKFAVNPPKDTKVDEAFLSKFKEVAHKGGLLPKQAQGLLDWYTGMEAEMGKTASEVASNKAKEQLDGLKKEWGHGFDKELSYAKMAVKEVGGEDFSKYLESSGLGNDVQLIKLMSKVGKLLGEDKIRGDGAGKFGKTPAEIDLEISRLVQDPAYTDGFSQRHKTVLAQVEELFKMKSA